MRSNPQSDALHPSIINIGSRPRNPFLFFSIQVELNLPSISVKTVLWVVCAGRSVRDGECIADVVNWGHPALSEPGFLILFEWTHPARTGPIGDNCTPLPPRRYTHSNRQRLVVCEGKQMWMSIYTWLSRELSWPFRVQGGRRGDRTTQVIFRHQSLETAIYLCVLQPLGADVYQRVSSACFSPLKLTYICACHLRGSAT